MAEGLLDKANIILTPTGYKAGTMYNVAPIESPYEDFDFARASVASRVNSSGLVEMVGRTLGSNLVQNGDFSEIGPDLVQNGTFDLGSELVTNGDFATDSDWTKGTGWTIANGIATYDGTAGTSAITQADVIEVGKTYKVTIEVISNEGTGANTIFLGGTVLNGSHLSVGTHTFYGATSNTNVKLNIYGRSGEVFQIDNVSVKEVPDWTLTQATVSNNTLQLSTTDGSYTAATQSLGSIGESYKIQLDVSNIVGTISVAIGGGTDVDITTNGTHTIYIKSASTTFELKRKFGITNVSASITNVSVQELDPNDYWNLGAGWSLGDNKASNDGSSGSNNLRQNDILTIGSTYKITITVSDYVSGNVQVSVGAAPRGTMSANGTYTFYQEATPTDDFYIIANAFEGSVSNISVQEIIDTNNIPRINYDSNGENGHWLLEPTSTNLLPYSEDFTTWTVSSGLSLTDNSIISPSGLNDGWKVESDGTSGFIPLRYAVSISGDNTFSVYAKQGTNRYITLRSLSGVDARANFDLQEGTSTSSNATSIIEDAGNGWYRCSMSFTGTNANVYIYPNEIGIADSGYIYLQFAQLEALSYATSYIPTLTGSTETRATETATGAGSAELINSTEGVLYAEIAALADDSTYRFISLNGGGYSNSIRIGYFTTSNTVEYRVVDSNAKQVEITHVISDTTDTIKLAAKYKANDFALWINGVEVATDTSGTVPSNLYELDFNDGNASNNSPFYGKCKELTVFGEALSDDELEKLTSWSSFNAMATDLGYTIE